MKIIILGAGAMGMLFGSYLSRNNDVWLLEIDKSRAEKIAQDGVMVHEKDGDLCFRPGVVGSSEGLPQADLIIVFVKSMFTLTALEQNKAVIGPNTYIMTLQNGAGHENKLLRYADEEHVIIGSTQHNSSVISNGYINHGGWGPTSIGLLTGDSSPLEPIAENIRSCGFDCVTSNEVKRQIWTKLFTNTAASSLTAIYQVPLGFIHDDPNAHALMEALCREAVAVANAECGNVFEEAEVIETVDSVCRSSCNGFTSIYADLRDGRKSEVDTISGAVIDAARKHGIPVPFHEAIVGIIRGLENKAKLERETK